MSVWHQIGRVASIENHTFLPAALGPASVVIDLGANTGCFAREIAKRYGVRCYGIEANPRLCAHLTDDERTTFHNVAICDRDAPITLNLSADHTSSSVVSEVPRGQGTVTVEGCT